MTGKQNPWILALLLLIMFARGIGAQDASDDPRYLRLIDFAGCRPSVAKIERVEQISLPDGSVVKPSRLDAQLLLLNLVGTAPEYGRISLNPFSFGVNFLHRGMLTSGLATAIGIRGTKPTGETIEIWYAKPEESFNYFVEKPGEGISIWVAAELPASVREFHLRIPTVLAEPVALPD